VNYGERRLRQQGPAPFGPNQRLPRDRTLDLPFVGSSLASKINDFGEMRIRFRFVLMTKVNGHEELWTAGGLPVDGLHLPLHGFRKSHHFVPASSDPDTLDRRGM